MAVFTCISNLIHQLLLILVIIHGTVSYEKILLEESRLCKLRPDGPDSSIILMKEKGSSKIVTQKTYFAEWTGRFNFMCSFSVKTLEDSGIYAVIQVLNFRKNETTGKCKDYVHFSVVQDFRSGFREKRHEKYFCGRMYAAQTYLANSNASGSRYMINPVAENSFVARDRQLYVSIYIAQERLLKNEKLEVKIAFTSFKEGCSQRSKRIRCKSCEWIWEGLAGDKIQNCPYTSCLDENQCRHLESPFGVHDIVSRETGTKVTVSAISALMITFFIFAICLCTCRRSGRCCWQIPQNDSVRVEMSRARSSADDDFGHQLPPEALAPSAPPASDMKDVPPSYESLFPSK